MSRAEPKHPQPNARPAPMPLGALAAGVGLSLLGSVAMAQSQTSTVDGTATESQTLPTVSVKAKRAPQAAPSKENLQTVTTNVGKGQQAIRDIPQSLSVITEKLLDDVKLDTLKEALHYTSGITFAATENGTDQDIRLRGFPVATVGDLMIDGMKDPSQYDRDTFNYDRIEVLRGSASMLFGRGSTGGVINQVTKKPMLADQSDVMATIGTGDYLRTTVDLNKRTDENAAIRINAMVTNADNYGAQIKKHGVAPTYAWGIGTANEFNIGLFYLKVDNVPMSNIRYLGGSVPDNTPRAFYGTSKDYLKGEATYLMGSWLHRLGGNAEVRTQFRSGTFDRATWGATAGYPTGTTAANLTNRTNLTVVGLTPRKDKISGTYLQSDYSNKLQLAGMRHEVQAGIDLAYEQADSYSSYNGVGANYAKGTVAVGGDNSYTPLLNPLYRKSADYKANSGGVYAQDLVSLTDTWKILAGLRWDRFKANTGQFSTSTGAQTGDSTVEYGSLWSHRIGALYQPTPEQSYHVSYGTSFNTSADTYKYTTANEAGIDPEKSRNIEIGAKLDWFNGALSTRGALFRTEKFNERTQDRDVADAGVYMLSGKRHAQGLELDIVGKLTEQLELHASLTHIFEAKIDKTGTLESTRNGVTTRSNATGQPVGLTPKHTGSMWLTYQASPALRLGVGARGASENRPLSATSGAASTTARAPGYVAYDAMVEYKFNQDVFAQVNVSNLTDRVYGDQLYPGFVTLGERRSIKFTVGTRF